MVIVTNYRPTSLNLVSDLDPGFLVVFSTPNPPWGLVDTRHGTGIFWPPKTGGREMFFFLFFFSDEVDVFFVGGYFWNVFFPDFLMFFFWGDFFGCLFWGFLAVVVAAWSVVPKRNSFSLYIPFFFLVRNLPDTFFVHLISWIQGGLPAFFFVASTKLRRFSVFKLPACCFLFFCHKINFGMDEIVRGRS